MKNLKVKILPDIVINQIAAGEVVERPSSVVKELVENSIDANATNITVIVANGGISQIEVIDDGVGMSREDAINALERFGTSKISSTEELFSISSYGFRGEALPSISSVSKFKLQTKSEDDIHGCEIEIGESGEKNIRGIDIVKGTKISVRSLFYNTPARKKFLKTEKTELGNIKQNIIDLSLAYPEIRFNLISDGREVFNIPCHSTLEERAIFLQCAGKEYIKSIREFSGGAFPFPIKVEAVLSKPIEYSHTAEKIRFFVNKRSVRDKLLLRAVRDAYGTFLKGAQYPQGVLSITIPPQYVDCNVHPQKSEVRFLNSDMIFRSVLNCIREGLNTDNPLTIRQYPTSVSDIFGNKSKIINSSFNKDAHLSAEFFGSGEIALAGSNNITSFIPEISLQDELFYQKNHDLRLDPKDFIFVDQLFKLFLIYKSENYFIILDQHAAHERIMFVKFKEQYLDQSIKAQELLFPEIIKIPFNLHDIIDRLIVTINSFGFRVEKFGNDALRVNAVPVILVDSDPISSLKEYLDSNFNFDDLSDSILEQRMDKIISLLACHGSIRRGKNISSEEAIILLNDLLIVEASSYCPHGRPVLKVFSCQQLEDLFGR